MCMKDLGDVDQLHLHFRDAHSREDPALLQNIKDLFGKVKKKGADILIPGKNDGEGGGLNTSSSFSADSSFSAIASAVSSEAKAIFGGSGTGQEQQHLQYDPVTGVRLSYSLASPRPQVEVANRTAEFREERRKRLDRNKSTNQVLVRLEKLMRDVPSDPAKRRAHEQAAVPWVEEDLVKLCPSCAKSFGLKRRKHHCRLCGGVMCGDCCTWVTFEFARKVLNPASISKFEEPAEENAGSGGATSEKKHGLLKKGLFKGSHESLNALANLVELGAPSPSEPQFRSCLPCRGILEQEEWRAETAATGSSHLLARYYEKLQDHMREGREQAEVYRQAVESLRDGEEEHDLRDVKARRMRLLRIAENIDAISGSILRLGTEEGEEASPAGPTQVQLQRRIRQDAVNYVKATLVALPDAPSEDEFDRLKARRVREAEARVEEERRAAKEARQRVAAMGQLQNSEGIGSRTVKNMLQPVGKGGPSVSPKEGINEQSKVCSLISLLQFRFPGRSNKPSVSYGSGLVLTSSSAGSFTSSSDPMVQQIRNLRDFIREAKRLNRADEVAALEENLREMQAEFQRVQSERKELEANYDDFKGLFHKHSPSKAKVDAEEEEEEGSKEAAKNNNDSQDGFDKSVSAAAAADEDSKEAPQEYVDIDEYDASGKNPFFDE